MDDQTTRLSEAVPLAGRYTLVFNYFFGGPRLLFSGPMIRLALIVMLTVWTCSAVILRLQIFYGSRKLMHEHNQAQSTSRTDAALERGSNV